MMYQRSISTFPWWSWLTEKGFFIQNVISASDTFFDIMFYNEIYSTIYTLSDKFSFRRWTIPGLGARLMRLKIHGWLAFLSRARSRNKPDFGRESRNLPNFGQENRNIGQESQKIGSA